ncbi:serine protease inhibitor Kazal-type 5 [Macrotis lagotis]|uniref:serine protease inhibitor Kazal-type 5 n=1 Tax=Macrotis lagotis TaxID=92651 RepID=UPI003D684F34
MQCAQSTHRRLARPVLTMKSSALFALLIVALGSIPNVASEDEIQDPCSDFRKFATIEGRLACTRENDPVPGPDGKTYGNRCSMCAELFLKEAQDKSKEDGKRSPRNLDKTICSEFRNLLRDGRLFCTRENDPIQGFDGKHYGNKCSMCKAFFQAEAKERERNEQNLRNKRESANTVSFKELCSPYRGYMRNGRMACTRENDPVLGPDGKMHGNTCSMCEVFFQQEAKEKAAEASKITRREADKDLCSEFRKQVRDGKLICTREHFPIRGPDGKMHGNKCSMCASILKLEEEEEKKSREDKKKVEAENKVKRETVQELCSEYRNYMRDGRLACTREHDPILGLDGKMHGNTCSMCEAFFKLEEEEKKKVDAEKKVKRETIQELCSEYRNYMRDGHLACTRENDPIMGLDGKMHGNTCSMCEAFFQQEAREKVAEASRAIMKREVQKDACDEFRSLVNNGNLFCTRENDPVRGPDGKTHGNKCAMCKALFQKEDEDRKKKDEDRKNAEGNNHGGGGAGKSQDQCAEFQEEWKKGGISCTRESDPVRDASGKSYNNKCAMCKEILAKEDEENKKTTNFRNNNSSSSEKANCDEFRKQMKDGKLICTRESDPVRGPDGKTHGNKCALCKEILEKEAQDKKSNEEKSSKEKDQCSEYRSLMNNGKYICTRENDPVRGPDGKTHLNKCAMCKVVLEREANERKRTKEENKSNDNKAKGNEDKCQDAHNRRNSGSHGCSRAADPAQVQAILKKEGNERETFELPELTETNRLSTHKKSAQPSKFGEMCQEFQAFIRGDSLICTRENSPVYDANGKVYRNKCAMCRELIKRETKERSKEKTFIKSLEEDKNETKPFFSVESEMCQQYRVIPRVGYLCPKNLYYVCGEDGRTYNHPCMLCHENLLHQTNIKMLREGRCEDEPSEPLP